MRKSPIYYIAPSAISITPNCNSSANDLAVYIARNTKIKVYSRGVEQLDVNPNTNTYREWTLTGRNRRLKGGNGPYTIYARLKKKGVYQNVGEAYLVFAAKLRYPDDNPYGLAGKWFDLHSYVQTDGLSEQYDSSGFPRVVDDPDYWWIRLGEVSEVKNGLRSVNLDTGILGTDQYNVEWALNPDGLPLRVDLSCKIGDKEVGTSPYVRWDESLLLSASLVEGWTADANERVQRWTILRNTGNESADDEWNGTAESSSSDSGAEPEGRTMEGGTATLHHLRGIDDFAGAVATVFTVIAWGYEQEQEEEDSSSSDSSSSDSSSSLEDSSDYEDVLVPLAVGTLTVMAETAERYELQTSTSIMAFDPTLGTYSPADGIIVGIRATNQRGDNFRLTNAQLHSAQLAVEYAPVGSIDWTLLAFSGAADAEAEDIIPTSAFAPQQNVAVRLVRQTEAGGSSSSSSDDADTEPVTVLAVATIAFVRNGEDSNVREWIYKRSDTNSYGTDPASISKGEVNPSGTADGNDENKNQDGWVPNGWHDNPWGVTDTLRYEFESYRDWIPAGSSSSSDSSSSDDEGHWGPFTKPLLRYHYGKDGQNGQNGISQPSYTQTQEAWSNDETTASGTTAPTTAHGRTDGTASHAAEVDWSDNTPANTSGYEYLWRRSRKMVLNAAGTAYEPAASDAGGLWEYQRLSGADGANGNDGAPGGNTATVYLYRRYAAPPSTWPKPTGMLWYKFADKKLYTFNSQTQEYTEVQDGAEILSGWHKDIPSGTDPIYVTAAIAYSTTGYDDIGINEWVAPVQFTGNGINSATVFLYKRASSLPNDSGGNYKCPQATLYYKFADGLLYKNAALTQEASKNDGLNGWEMKIPTSDSNACYVIQAAALSAESYDAIEVTKSSGEYTKNDWSSVRKLVEDGKDGENGQDGRDGQDGQNGKDGEDGYSVTLSQPVIIINQSETEGNDHDFPLDLSNAYSVLTIRKGKDPVDNAMVEIIGDGKCQYKNYWWKENDLPSWYQDTDLTTGQFKIEITGVNKPQDGSPDYNKDTYKGSDGNTYQNYYREGRFTIKVTPYPYTQGTEITLYLDFRCNLNGTFKTKIEGDVETSVAEKITYAIDPSGLSVTTLEQAGTYIRSASEKTDALSETVDGVQTAMTEFRQTVHGISMSVWDGTTANANLLQNSLVEISTGTQATDNAAPMITLPTLTSGRKYTLQMCARNNATALLYCDGTLKATLEVAYAEKKTVSCTFEATSGTWTLRYGKKNSSLTGFATFDWLKLEEGSQATPWCPNESDAKYHNLIENFRAADINVDGLRINTTTNGSYKIDLYGYEVYTSGTMGKNNALHNGRPGFSFITTKAEAVLSYCIPKTSIAGTKYYTVEFYAKADTSYKILIYGTGNSKIAEDGLIVDGEATSSTGLGGITFPASSEFVRHIVAFRTVSDVSTKNLNIRWDITSASQMSLTVPVVMQKDFAVKKDAMMGDVLVSAGISDASVFTPEDTRKDASASMYVCAIVKGMPSEAAYGAVNIALKYGTTNLLSYGALAGNSCYDIGNGWYCLWSVVSSGIGTALANTWKLTLTASKELYAIAAMVGRKPSVREIAGSMDNYLAKRTGMDIESGIITAQTDKFQIVNSRGEQTFSVDEDGNLVAKGDASIGGTIRARNLFRKVSLCWGVGNNDINVKDSDGEQWYYVSSLQSVDQIYKSSFTVGEYISLSEIYKRSNGYYAGAPNGFLLTTEASDIVVVVNDGAQSSSGYKVPLPRAADFVGKVVEVHNKATDNIVVYQVDNANDAFVSGYIGSTYGTVSSNTINAGGTCMYVAITTVSGNYTNYRWLIL